MTFTIDRLMARKLAQIYLLQLGDPDIAEDMIKP